MNLVVIERLGRGACVEVVSGVGRALGQAAS